MIFYAIGREWIFFSNILSLFFRSKNKGVSI
nr:MAG TPA: hypothetical protein [Caudoviricetes sp.]